MRIEDIMSTPAITCRQDDTLSTAARLMWEHDCGAVPVTDQEGHVVGMVTDRDICMATYTKGAAPGSIRVSDAMAPQVASCRDRDSLEVAERLMSEKQVRRVPVVDKDNRPVGLLSVNDIARSAATQNKQGIDRQVVETLAAICKPRSQDDPAKQQVAAG